MLVTDGQTCLTFHQARQKASHQTCFFPTRRVQTQSKQLRPFNALTLLLSDATCTIRNMDVHDEACWSLFAISDPHNEKDATAGDFGRVDPVTLFQLDAWLVPTKPVKAPPFRLRNWPLALHVATCHPYAFLLNYWD